MGEAKNLSNTIGRTFGGTLIYMSPEQSKGRQFDEQLGYSTHMANTDIWYGLFYIIFEIIQYSNSI